MHVTASSACAAAFLAVAAANPVAKKSSFSVQQVAVRSTKRTTAPQLLLKPYLKYGKLAAAPSHVVKAAGNGSVAALPQPNDEEYLSPVTIGADTLNLDFDTGSSDLWVFSDLQAAGQTTGHSIYHSKKTGKVKSGYSWNITYGDQSGAAGKVYTDKVVVGGVTATSQAVEAATSISAQFQQDTDTDGLLGLAFSSINTVKPVQQITFFDSVKASLPKALFAATLKHNAPGTYDFGFIDSSKYKGTLTYANVDSSQGFWTITAGTYAIGNGSFSSSIGKAIADTGTTLALLPDSVVAAYYAKVKGASNDQTQGGYVFPCSATTPDFKFKINSVTFTIPGSYINFAPVDNTGAQCFGGIQSNSGLPFSILGDVFLKAHYVVFDQSTSTPRLGVAPQA